MSEDGSIHDMGFALKDAAREFERILSNLGFEISEKIEVGGNLIIIAKKFAESIKLIFKPGRLGVMGIQRKSLRYFAPERSMNRFSKELES